jgi:hypothetical protein
MPAKIKINLLENNKIDTFKIIHLDNDSDYTTVNYTLRNDPEDESGYYYEEYQSDSKGKKINNVGTNPRFFPTESAIVEMNSELASDIINQIEIISDGKKSEYYGNKIEEGKRDAAEVIADTLKPVAR